MKIAIRDDDTSYWTYPEELEAVYKNIWDSKGCVSLAVIPFAVKSLFMEDRSKFFQDNLPKPLHEHTDLINFLKENLNGNRISVMLHGYTHQYKISLNKYAPKVIASKENLDSMRAIKDWRKLVWHGEYKWKKYGQLKIETKEGKEYLEDILQTKITVFVPPSNDISSEGAKAVAQCGLNISGTMRLSNFNRELSFYSIKNWVLKFIWKLIYNEVYPFKMHYGTHSELFAHSIVPGLKYENLVRTYENCKTKDIPFILATHYWEVLQNRELRSSFEDIIKLLSYDNILTVDEVFKN